MSLYILSSTKHSTPRLIKTSVPPFTLVLSRILPRTLYKPFQDKKLTHYQCPQMDYWVVRYVQNTFTKYNLTHTTQVHVHTHVRDLNENKHLVSTCPTVNSCVSSNEGRLWSVDDFSPPNYSTTLRESKYRNVIVPFGGLLGPNSLPYERFNNINLLKLSLLVSFTVQSGTLTYKNFYSPLSIQTGTV